MSAPVIVSGIQRSGVRLVTALLAQNDAFVTGPELIYLVNLVRTWREIESNLGANLARNYDVTPEILRAEFEKTLLAPFAHKSADKRPLIHSFLASTVLDIFAALLPDAKFVFVTRAPQAVVASLLTQDWRDPRTGAPLSHTRDAAAAADYWLNFNRLAHPHVQALQNTGRLHIVEYEALCAKPARVLAELAAFIGVADIAKTVSTEASEMLALTDAQIYPPVKPGKIVRDFETVWRSHLGADQQKIIGAREAALKAETKR